MSDKLKLLRQQVEEAKLERVRVEEQEKALTARELDFQKKCQAKGYKSFDQESLKAERKTKEKLRDDHVAKVEAILRGEVVGEAVANVTAAVPNQISADIVSQVAPAAETVVIPSLPTGMHLVGEKDTIMTASQAIAKAQANAQEMPFDSPGINLPICDNPLRKEESLAAEDKLIDTAPELTTAEPVDPLDDMIGDPEELPPAPEPDLLFEAPPTRDNPPATPPDVNLDDVFGGSSFSTGDDTEELPF